MQAGTSPHPNDAPVTPPARGKSHTRRRDDDAGAVAAQHCIMFWVLTVLAMVVFAPCVLMPIYAETEQILEAERKLTQLVADLNAQADHNDARIRALLADPLVNERIVRRELNYRPEGEQIIQWPAAELASLQLNLSDLTPPAKPVQEIDPYPAWVKALAQWLPAWPWRKLFVDTPNRYVLLTMAAGLLATAFFLYGPVPLVARRQKAA